MSTRLQLPRASLATLQSAPSLQGEIAYSTDSGQVLIGDGVNPLAPFSGGGSSYTAGNGLQLSTGIFSVVPDGSSISIGVSGVRLSATYGGQTSISTLGTINTGVWHGTAVDVAYGGTGASDAATALSNLGAVGTSDPIDGGNF